MDAVTRGTLEGAQLLLNIVAMLVVFVALVSLVNSVLAPILCRDTRWALAAARLAAGISWHDAPAAGAFWNQNNHQTTGRVHRLGEKTALSSEPAAADVRAVRFANFAARHLIGGLGTMCPERRGEVVALGIKSIIAGTLGNMSYCGYRRLARLILYRWRLSRERGGAFGFETSTRGRKSSPPRPSAAAAARFPGSCRASATTIPRYPLPPHRFLWNRARLPFEWPSSPGLALRPAGEDQRSSTTPCARSSSIPSPFDTARTRSIRRSCATSASPAFACITRSTRRASRTRCWVGASYARLGKSQLYGLSARGLAIDPVSTAAKEFPRFTEFWLEKPAANVEELTVLRAARLAAPSGAYRFVLQPGEETVLEVKARLYLREKVAKLGIGAAHQHVLLRREPARAARGLPPRGARLRRLRAARRRRRVAVAALVNPRRPLFSAFPTTSPRASA